MCKHSSFSIYSPFTTFCLDYSHSSGCEAVSHGGLIYISLVTNSVELHWLITHACVCPGEMCIQIFCPFFNQGFFFNLALNVLYIWIQVFYQINICSFFSKYVVSLFSLLIVPFEAPKFSTFMKSNF